MGSTTAWPATCSPRQAGWNDGATILYRASKYDCTPCPMKPRCCPKEPVRKIPRSINEGARDICNSDEGRTSRRERKKVEMLFAHLKRILKLDRLRLRGPNGARDEFHLAAAAQNLRKLAKLIPMPAPVSQREGHRLTSSIKRPKTSAPQIAGSSTESVTSAFQASAIALSEMGP